MPEAIISSSLAAAFISDFRRLQSLSMAESQGANELGPEARASLEDGRDTEGFAESLRLVSKELSDVRRQIFEQAKRLRDVLVTDWPDNPRLCDGSIFGPLGLVGREVPLTTAIAWLLSPSQTSPGFHEEMLAATLRAIIAPDLRTDVRELSEWTVRAEEQVRSAGNARGRVDIYLCGYLGGRHHQVAIEAKINAAEGKGQLEKYEIALRERAETLRGEHGPTTIVVFLTPSGRAPRASNSAVYCSYATLLESWISTLKEHSNSASAPFARMLLADIAREHAAMHLGDQLSGRNGSLPAGTGMRAANTRGGS